MLPIIIANVTTTTTIKQRKENNDDENDDDDDERIKRGKQGRVIERLFAQMLIRQVDRVFQSKRTVSDWENWC